MSSHFDTVCPLNVWSLPLRIQRRGSFFGDDLFLGSRNYFENAARDLLREIDTVRNEDSFRSYRNLRERQLSGTDMTTKVAEEENMFKIVMDVQGFVDEGLQVKIIGPNTIAVEGKQQSGNGSTFSKRSFTRRFSLPDTAILQEASSVLSSDNILTVNIPKRAKALTFETKSIEQQIQEHLQSSKSESESIFKKDESAVDSTSSLKDIFQLPIVPRSSFFQDSFFENVRQNFQKSVDEKMNQRLQRIRSIGDMSLFKKERESKEEDIQAVAVSEDDLQYKITLDVQGFDENDLKITALSDTEIVVEGCTKKETTYSSSCSTFRKRFPLPSGAKIQEAKSALSSDGILSIFVPKKQQPISEYSTSVKNEASDILTKVIKEEQSRTSTSSKVNVNQKERTSYVPVVMELQESVNRETSTATSQSNVGSKSSNEYKVPIELEDEKKGSSNISAEYHKETSSQRLESNIQSQNVDSDKVTSSSKVTEVEIINRDKKDEHYVPIVMDAGISIHTQNVKEVASPKVVSESHNVESITKSRDQRHHLEEDLRIIPVSFKGSLYSDSIFEDARRSFEIEAQNALNRYKLSTVKEDVGTGEKRDTLSQQSTKIITKQTSPTIFDDDHYYKIVLDVYGYDEREIKIKIMGEDEISVEGHSESTKGNSVSKHSFHRTFKLPGLMDLDRASTALSSEGILTISIPKKNQVLLKNEKLIPITSQIEKEIEKSKEMKTTLIVDTSGVVQESKKEPKYPGLCSLLTGSTTQEETSHESRQHEEILPSYSRALSDESSVSSADLTSRSTSVTTTKSDYHDISSDVQDIKTVACKDDSLFNLPIVSKGHFFDDSFFHDSRSLFESALKNNMDRFKRSSSFVDDLGYYQSLRQGRLADSGNQIATINEDDKFVKIIVDAHGFNEENLKIKVGVGNEITIEGSYEEKTGNSLSKKSFKKSFTLPTYVDVSRATSALSSDGVLNILIPKLLQQRIEI